MRPGSELEINLSYQCRKKIMDVIHVHHRSGKTRHFGGVVSSPSARHRSNTGASSKAGSSHKLSRHDSDASAPGSGGLLTWIFEENISNKQLFHVLDAAKVQLIQLLRDSYVRFASSNEYVRFVKAVDG